MMRKVALIIVVAGASLIAGCAVFDQPTFAEVRQETLDAMDEIVALIPVRGRVEQTPEFKPYRCDDPLLLGSGDGSFFTGQWTVAVPPDFDVGGFLDRVPTMLPEWTEEDLGVPAKEPYIYLVRKTPRMTISLEESTLDGGKAIELLAISRCGIEDSGDREAHSQQTGSPRTNSPTTPASPAPISSAGRRFPFTANE